MGEVLRFLGFAALSVIPGAVTGLLIARYVRAPLLGLLTAGVWVLAAVWIWWNLHACDTHACAGDVRRMIWTYAIGNATAFTVVGWLWWEKHRRRGTSARTGTG